MKPITKYEVYEDNAGGLYMCIMDDEGNIHRIYGGFEWAERGVMEAAIKELDEEPDAYESWDGDVAGICDGEVDVEGLYRIISYMTLIADNGGIYEFDMGAAGLRAFGIEY